MSKSTEYYRNNPEKVKAYRKKYRDANPEKVYRLHRTWQLKTLYGISLEEYEIRLNDQLFACKLCFRPAKDCPHGLLHVDHDHKTGAVRDLLCSNCNTMLGLAGENADLLRSAAAYLEKAKV